MESKDERLNANDRTRQETQEAEVSILLAHVLGRAVPRVVRVAATANLRRADRIEKVDTQVEEREQAQCAEKVERCKPQIPPPVHFVSSIAGRDARGGRDHQEKRKGPPGRNQEENAHSKLGKVQDAQQRWVALSPLHRPVHKIRSNNDQYNRQPNLAHASKN
eukprot:TRINITY_DN2836_c3_g1_i1.p1 TRINITY_DN2836_c3_g1~~TRINITY_DN2836_c3_g1_i1.p1  ORF type:complete len:183 (+),score=40.77 TRINITY_DN2836_c3_g1_i1:62-550(+)